MRFWKRNIPAPISVPVSVNFLEADGFWSTFELEVGSSSSGAQSFNAIISMSSTEVWLPTPEGCANRNLTVWPRAPSISECTTGRGILQYNGVQSNGYVANRSDTSDSAGVSEGRFRVSLNQLNIDLDSAYGNMLYTSSGLSYQDVVQLRTVRTPNTLLYGIDQLLPFLPSLGIGYAYTLVSSGLVSCPLRSLYEESEISSNSWGFTAGAQYEERSASLILGGYDQSRIGGHFANFPMRDSAIFTSVRSVNLSYTNASASVSMPASFQAAIDSTLPYLMLPNNTIDWLKSRLHLVEIAELNLFVFNGSDPFAANNSLNDLNGFSFELTSWNSVSSSSVTINLPFSALIATASWTWGFGSTVSIFLVRRSAIPYAILGRAFMQEAYVVADYDRDTFGISQTARHPPAESIVPIYSDGYLRNNTGLANIAPKSADSSLGYIISSANNSSNGTSSHNDSTSSAGATIAGVFLGCFIAAIGIPISFWYTRRRKRGKIPIFNADEKSTYNKAELDGSGAPAKEAMSHSYIELENHAGGAQLDTPVPPKSPVELEAGQQLIQSSDHR